MPGVISSKVYGGFGGSYHCEALFADMVTLLLQEHDAYIEIDRKM